MARRPRIPTPNPADSPVMVAAGSVWALLAGMGLLLMGNALQYSLLGVRASNEGFSSTATGVVMSAYFVGFLFGSIGTVRAVRRVGHLRVFAAAAALASIAILIQSQFVTPTVWAVTRIGTGIAYAAAYIVTESWLNDRVTNEHRGGLLGVYMIVSFIGMGGGQLLLNAGDPDSSTLFILVSVLISSAAIPILLSVLPQPAMEQPARLGPLEMFRQSPLGTTGCMTSGMLQGALFGMGAVYARAAGLSVAETSVFMFTTILGAALVQYPVGKLSDRIDRRRVITAVALFGAVAYAAAVPAGHLGGMWVIGSAIVFGIPPLTLYSLSIAYANDHIEQSQRVAASSVLNLVFAFGALLGPSIAGGVMDLLGPDGFPWLLAAGTLGLGLFAIVRMRMRPPLPLEEQSAYAPMPQRTAWLTDAWEESVAAADARQGESATGDRRARTKPDSSP